MPKFMIIADPKQNVALSVGSSFIAFDGVHDVAKTPITNRRKFIVNLKEDDILWLIEGLSNELSEDKRSEVLSLIEGSDNHERAYEISRERNEAVELDAARYMWLRSQHFNDSPLSVVIDPKDSVKLGRDCPSLERLDEIIDTEMGKRGE